MTVLNSKLTDLYSMEYVYIILNIVTDGSEIA